MTIRFCPGISCPHYGQATKYHRKCYYDEPQCIKGKADQFIETIRILVSKRYRGMRT
jgi:hypothetical protein